MAVEQSLHYCLSESKMLQLDSLEYYVQPLGSNVQTVQVPSLHSHFYLRQIFLECLYRGLAVTTNKL